MFLFFSQRLQLKFLSSKQPVNRAIQIISFGIHLKLTVDDVLSPIYHNLRRNVILQLVQLIVYITLLHSKDQQTYLKYLKLYLILQSPPIKILVLTKVQRKSFIFSIVQLVNREKQFFATINLHQILNLNLKIYSHNIILQIRANMDSIYHEDSDAFRQIGPQKAKYTKTSMKKKTQLIELVLKQKFSIYKASKKLKISNSTAKSIITNYTKFGALLQRNSKSKLQKLSNLKNQNQRPLQQNYQVKQEVQQEAQYRPQQYFTQTEKMTTNYKLLAQNYPFLEMFYPLIYSPPLF